MDNNVNEQPVITTASENQTNSGQCVQTTPQEAQINTNTQTNNSTTVQANDQVELSTNNPQNGDNYFCN